MNGILQVKLDILNSFEINLRKQIGSVFDVMSALRFQTCIHVHQCHISWWREMHIWWLKFVLISRNERSPASPERSAGIFLHCDSHLTLHDCRSCPLSFITRNNVTFIPAITIMRFSTCHSRPAAAVRVICWIFLWIQPQRQHEESLHASNLPGKLTSESAIFCLLTLNDCYLQDPWLYSSSSERVRSFCSKTTFWSRWW